MAPTAGIWEVTVQCSKGNTRFKNRKARELGWDVASGIETRRSVEGIKD